jgi:hypothetical protein
VARAARSHYENRDVFELIKFLSVGCFATEIFPWQKVKNTNFVAREICLNYRRPPHKSFPIFLGVFLSLALAEY